MLLEHLFKEFVCRFAPVRAFLLPATLANLLRGSRLRTITSVTFLKPLRLLVKQKGARLVKEYLGDTENGVRKCSWPPARQGPSTKLPARWSSVPPGEERPPALCADGLAVL